MNTTLKFKNIVINLNNIETSEDDYDSEQITADITIDGKEAQFHEWLRDGELESVDCSNKDELKEFLHGIFGEDCNDGAYDAIESAITEVLPQIDTVSVTLEHVEAALHEEGYQIKEQTSVHNKWLVTEWDELERVYKNVGEYPSLASVLVHVV